MKLLKILEKLDKKTEYHLTSIVIYGDGSGRFEQGDLVLGTFDDLDGLNDLAYRLFFDRKSNFEVTL